MYPPPMPKFDPLRALALPGFMVSTGAKEKGMRFDDARALVNPSGARPGEVREKGPRPGPFEHHHGLCEAVGLHAAAGRDHDAAQLAGRVPGVRVEDVVVHEVVGERGSVVAGRREEATIHRDRSDDGVGGPGVLDADGPRLPRPPLPFGAELACVDEGVMDAALPKGSQRQVRRISRATPFSVIDIPLRPRVIRRAETSIVRQSTSDRASATSAAVGVRPWRLHLM